MITKKAIQKKAVKQKISLSVSEKKNLYPDYVTYANEEFTDLVSDQEGFTKRLKKAKTDGAKKPFKKNYLKRLVPCFKMVSKFIRHLILPYSNEPSISLMRNYLTKV
ncbi:hypothetical protein ACEQPO_23675 [Bacillus sp. SL00103]